MIFSIYRCIIIKNVVCRIAVIIMNILLYVEINLIGIVFLLVMLYSINAACFDVDKVGKTLFKIMLIVNIIVFVFDICMFVLDGKMFFGSRALLMISTVLYLLCNPIACLSWALYGDYSLHGDVKALKQRLWLYSIPFILCAVLILCSIKTGWIFYLDYNNSYMRGPMCLAVPLITSVYLFLIAFMAFIKLSGSEKSLNKEIYLYIFIFPVLPAIGTIFQMLFYGAPLIWICMTVSIFFVFVNIQNRQLLIDRLTGVYNRYYLEFRLDYAMKNIDEKSDLYVFMVDIDRFKEVNDNYGHIEGDLVLKTVASILNQVCKKSGYVARYGGDEFLIMHKCKKDADINLFVESINKAVDDRNRKNNLPFKIEISIGYYKYDPMEIKSINQFVEKADETMYFEKKNKDIARAEWR